MKTTKNIIFIALISMITSICNAQDSIQDTKLKHGLGMGAGFTTGYGISYKYTPNKLGVQVNFAPYKSKTLQRYSLGVTFTYTLIEKRISKLYLYEANHFFYTKDIFNNYDINGNVTGTYSTKESYLNNGLGFGFELTIAKSIGLNLMSGYAFYDNFNNINITGEMALHYKF